MSPEQYPDPAFDVVFTRRKSQWYGRSHYLRGSFAIETRVSPFAEDEFEAVAVWLRKFDIPGDIELCRLFFHEGPSLLVGTHEAGEPHEESGSSSWVILPTGLRQWATALREADSTPLIEARRRTDAFVGSLPTTSGRSLTFAKAASLQKGLIFTPRPTDPTESFRPSTELVMAIEASTDLLQQSLEQECDLPPSLDTTTSNESEQADLLKNTISEIVETVLAGVARERRELGCESIKVTQRETFSADLCARFVDRLCLHPYDPSDILDQLYEELLSFVVRGERIRNWGRLSLDSEGQLVLHLGAEEAANDDVASPVEGQD